MRTPLKAVLGLLAGAALCLTPQAAAQAAPPGHSTTATGEAAGARAAADPAYKVLVFSRTAGF
ncbi:glycosyl hydrolase, partial [Streptomyces sp. SID2131]|nr:glycosyl hydrolase [Streptomyces sp. SID2131]